MPINSKCGSYPLFSSSCRRGSDWLGMLYHMCNLRKKKRTTLRRASMYNHVMTTHRCLQWAHGSIPGVMTEDASSRRLLMLRVFSLPFRVFLVEACFVLPGRRERRQLVFAANSTNWKKSTFCRKVNIIAGVVSSSMTKRVWKRR